MQYYKGNALQKELDEGVEIERKSNFHLFLRLIGYPFVLIYWIVANFIHKSMEDE